jgi:hypothetical protein
MSLAKPVIAPTYRQYLNAQKNCDIIIPRFQGQSTGYCYIPKIIEIYRYDLDIPTQLQFSNIKASYNI